MSFEAGQFLVNRELWLETLGKASKLNIHIDDYIADAINTGQLDLGHRDIYRRNQKDFWFNHKKFANENELFSYKFQNYSGALKSPVVFERTVLGLEKMGAIVRAKEGEDINDWVINPVDLLGLEGKERLSVHTKINVFYKKKEVRVDMEALGTDTEALVDMKGEKLHAVDCSKGSSS